MNTLKRMRKLVVFLTLAMILAGTSGVYAMDKININTAPVEQLVQLDRIGTKYAERIIAYREKFGPFKNPQDIMDVKGIGQKTWEANQDRIVVDL